MRKGFITALSIALVALAGCRQAPPPATPSPSEKTTAASGKAQEAPPIICPAAAQPVAFRMADAQHGWLLTGAPADATLLSTNDGGKHWQDITPPELHAAQQGGPASVYLFGSGYGLVAVQSGERATDLGPAPGAGVDFVPVTIYRTTDGGETWQTATVKGPGSATLQFAFAGSLSGWLIASTGPATGLMFKYVYATTDGGATWALVPPGADISNPNMMGTPGHLPDSEYTEGVAFRSAAEGWVTLISRTTKVPLFHTTDGGRTWQLQPFPLSAPYQDVSYGNPAPPVFFGASQMDGVMPVAFSTKPNEVVIFRTVDGGKNWTPGGAILGTPSYGFGMPGSFWPYYSFTDAEHGWMLISANDTGDPELFATQDGGQTWQQVSSHPPFKYGRLQFISATTGWAIGWVDVGGGGQQQLYTTQDGGATWRVQCPDAGTK